jgi:hypothetical protein
MVSFANLQNRLTPVFSCSIVAWHASSQAPLHVLLLTSDKQIELHGLFINSNYSVKGYGRLVPKKLNYRHVLDLSTERHDTTYVRVLLASVVIPLF